MTDFPTIEVLAHDRQAEIDRHGAEQDAEQARRAARLVGLDERQRDLWIPTVLATSAAVAVGQAQGIAVLLVLATHLVLATPGFLAWALVTGLAGMMIGAIVAGSMREPGGQFVAVQNAPTPNVMPAATRAILHLAAGIVVGFAASAQGLLLAVLAGGAGPRPF